VNPLIKTLVEIYGRIGDFHITPCDGAIPISEADRLAEKAVEAYAKTVWEDQAAEIERLREALVTVRARIEDIENPFEDGTKQEHIAFEKAVDAASLIASVALGETE
jgi:signal transduction protein with GAF and PtsI domain